MEDDSSPTVETTTAAPTFASAAADLEASSASPPPSTSESATAPAAIAQAGPEGDAGLEGVTPDTAPKGTRLPDGTFAPPEHRWPTILENQRTKAAKEAEDKVRAEYAWAQGIQEEQRAYLPKALQLAQWLEQDAPAAVAWLQQQVAAHVGKPSEPDPEPQPDAAVQLPDGSQIPVYTAEGQRKHDAWLREQMRADFDQRQQQAFQPLQGVLEAYETQQANVSMSQAIQRMEQGHSHFAAHKADVLAAMKADKDLWEFAGQYPERAMQIAYARVVESKILPTLAGQERSQVVADMHRKSAASTIRPSAAAVSVPKRPKTMYEAAKLVEEELGGR